MTPLLVLGKIPDLIGLDSSRLDDDEREERCVPLDLQMVADELGWSRDLVAKYAALRNIGSTAWGIIVTAVTNAVTALMNGCHNEESALKVVTFSEYLA